MDNKIRYHKRSEKWYNRYNSTIWIGYETLFTIVSAYLAFYWLNSGGIKLSIVMTINVILGFSGVIRQSMKLEDRA